MRKPALKGLSAPQDDRFFPYASNRSISLVRAYIDAHGVIDDTELFIEPDLNDVYKLPPAPLP